MNFKRYKNKCTLLLLLLVDKYIFLAVKKNLYKIENVKNNSNEWIQVVIFKNINTFHDDQKHLKKYINITRHFKTWIVKNLVFEK